MLIAFFLLPCRLVGDRCFTGARSFTTVFLLRGFGLGLAVIRDRLEVVRTLVASFLFGLAAAVLGLDAVFGVEEGTLCLLEAILRFALVAIGCFGSSSDTVVSQSTS